MQAHLSWQRSDDKDVYAELYRPYKHLIHPSINLTHINITYQLLLSSSPSHLSSSIENWRIHHSSPHQKLSNADLTNLEAGSWSKIRYQIFNRSSELNRDDPSSDEESTGASGSLRIRRRSVDRKEISDDLHRKTSERTI